MPEQIHLTPRQIRMRAYYEANKDSEKEKKRAYYEANRDPELAKGRAWYAANKEARKEKKRAWVVANPELIRNAKAKRRDVSGEITPGFVQKLLELQRWTCVVCNKDLRYGYHVDHITPVAKGGENTDYNVQALCPKCNLEKGDKDPIDFMQSRGFLL